MSHACGMAAVPASIWGSQMKAAWENRLTAVKASPAARVSHTAGSTGRNVSWMFFFMARAIPANMETRNRGASNAAAGRVSQRSHVQRGETAVRRPVLLIRRPRGGGAGAAAWFIYPLIGPDIAGRASLGNDDFLAYFQGEVWRYFLLYFHKFVRILELDAHADHFDGFHPAVHDGACGR